MSNVFSCFSKASPKEEYTNVACSIILFWSVGNISSSVRQSFLLISPDYNADIFTASMLISYCSFSSLILSSVVTISFHVPCKKLFLKCKELSDAKVVSFTKEECGLAEIFFKDS